MHSLDVLFQFSVESLDLSEVLAYLAQRVKVGQFVNLSCKEGLRSMTDLSLLVGCIVVIGNASTILKRVVHGQLLLEVAYFLLIAFDHQVLVEGHIDCSFIGDAHHTCRKFEGANGLFEMGGLWPDVGNHNGFTVAS